MKRPAKRTTIFGVGCALALGTLFLPVCRADSWVIVNPDGTVTRTQITGAGTLDAAPAHPNQPTSRATSSTVTGVTVTTAAPPVAGTSRSLPFARMPDAGAGVNGTVAADQGKAPAASRRHRDRVYYRVENGLNNGYWGGYPQPFYPQPVYPPYYGTYPQPSYSGPIGPAPSYGSPAWITSIPLGQTYPAYPYAAYPYQTYPGYPGTPFYAPQCPPPTAYYSYPASPAYGYPYGYDGGGYSSYSSGSASIGGSIAIGGGGSRVILGGGRTTTSQSGYGF